MPVHDWTRVDAGLFHAFHQNWMIALCHALNRGGLPRDYFALPEQVIKGPVPDVLTLRLTAERGDAPDPAPGLAVADAPPRARHVQQTEVQTYARKADRIAVHHRHGDVVAVVEIVSQGNKASRSELRAFVEKAAALLQQGIHLLIIDLFPPSKRDPQGIHKAIWDELEEQPFEMRADKPLTLVSYSAGAVKTAYVEPVGVGDALPAMPLFLKSDFYVPTPLETTYQTAWEGFPDALKPLLDSPASPPARSGP
jgi:hypothetical protein